MAKKKKSVTLFEAISRSKEEQEKSDLSIPVWMGSTSTETEVPKAVAKKIPPPAWKGTAFLGFRKEA